MPLYMWFLIRRTIVLVIFLLMLSLYNLLKRQEIKPIWLIGIMCVYLLFPQVMMLKDGGSKLLWSPIYEVITFRQMDSYDDNNVLVPGRKGTYWFLFPNNTKDFTDV